MLCERFQTCCTFWWRRELVAEPVYSGIALPGCRKLQTSIWSWSMYCSRRL